MLSTIQETECLDSKNLKHEWWNENKLETSVGSGVASTQNPLRAKSMVVSMRMADKLSNTK